MTLSWKDAKDQIGMLNENVSLIDWFRDVKHATGLKLKQEVDELTWVNYLKNNKLEGKVLTYYQQETKNQDIRHEKLEDFVKFLSLEFSDGPMKIRRKQVMENISIT